MNAGVTEATGGWGARFTCPWRANAQAMLASPEGVKAPRRSNGTAASPAALNNAQSAPRSPPPAARPASMGSPAPGPCLCASEWTSVVSSCAPNRCSCGSAAVPAAVARLLAPGRCRASSWLPAHAIWAMDRGPMLPICPAAASSKDRSPSSPPRRRNPLPREESPSLPCPPSCGAPDDTPEGPSPTLTREALGANAGAPRVGGDS